MAETESHGAGESVARRREMSIPRMLRPAHRAPPAASSPGSCGPVVDVLFGPVVRGSITAVPSAASSAVVLLGRWPCCTPGGTFRKFPGLEYTAPALSKQWELPVRRLPMAGTDDSNENERHNHETHMSHSSPPCWCRWPRCTPPSAEHRGHPWRRLWRRHRRLSRSRPEPDPHAVH